MRKVSRVGPSATIIVTISCGAAWNGTMRPASPSRISCELSARRPAARWALLTGRPKCQAPAVGFAGCVVAAEHHAAALLRRLEPGENQPFPLQAEHRMARLTSGEACRSHIPRTGRNTSSHNSGSAVPSSSCGLGDRGDRELKPLHPLALRSRSVGRPARVTGPRRQVAPRELADRAEQSQQQIAPAIELVLEEARAPTARAHGSLPREPRSDAPAQLVPGSPEDTSAGSLRSAARSMNPNWAPATAIPPRRPVGARSRSR